LRACNSLPRLSTLARRPLLANWANLAGVALFAADSRIAISAVDTALALRANLAVPPVTHRRHLLGDHLVDLEG
jgi:hypothetical protein